MFMTDEEYEAGYLCGRGSEYESDSDLVVREIPEFFVND